MGKAYVSEPAREGFFVRHHYGDPFATFAFRCGFHGAHELFSGTAPPVSVGDFEVEQVAEKVVFEDLAGEVRRADFDVFPMHQLDPPSRKTGFGFLFRIHFFLLFESLDVINMVTLSRKSKFRYLHMTAPPMDSRVLESAATSAGF